MSAVTRDDVDLDHGELSLERGLREQAIDAEAGVVDEHVHGEALRRHLLRNGPRGVRVGQVAGDHDGPRAELFARVRGR